MVVAKDMGRAGIGSEDTAQISPDFYNQGRRTGDVKPYPAAREVKHYEIGEATSFLRPFGKTYREALENLVTGSIQIIGLDEVKTRYKERWGEIRENIVEIAEAYIGRKLGRHDIFVPLDDGHFALLFANASRQEALQRSRAIANDLVNKLFGEMPGGELISVEAAMLTIEDFEGLDKIRSLEGLVSCFHAAILRAQERETREVKLREADVGIRFRPLINRRKRFVGLYEALDASREGDIAGTAMPEDLRQSGSHRTRAELDCVILTELGNIIEKLDIQGRRPALLLPVRFETLANSYFRSKYARLLATLPNYTDRHLILNVQDVPDGVPNSRYRQILGALRQLVLGFAFEVDIRWKDFASINDLPVFAISLVGHERLDLGQIAALFTAAKEQGLKCIWRSLDNDELARAAFKMQVDYVSGPIFGSAQNAPAKPFSLPEK
tara:strand:- start:4206 stop:5525 length:1320 start_codon:yes stop_codon:yes gene_type:complete